MNRRLKFLVNSPVWDALLSVFLLPPLLKAAGHYRPKRLLEIGCGQGDTTRLLLRRFPDAAITAIDYDAGQVALAGRRVKGSQVSFLQADAGRLPFDDDSFDAVLEFNSLHHIVHWQMAIAEIGRVLSPGGMFAAMDETAAFFNPLFRWYDQPESLFTKADLLRTAADAGLNPVASVGSETIIKIVFEKK